MGGQFFTDTMCSHDSFACPEIIYYVWISRRWRSWRSSSGKLTTGRWSYVLPRDSLRYFQWYFLQRRAQDFFIGLRTKAESGMGFLGRGSNPLPTTGGLGSAVSSPSGVRGGAPISQFFTIFSIQDDLSWHYNIANCGLSCSQDPRASPLRMPLHL